LKSFEKRMKKDVTDSSDEEDTSGSNIMMLQSLGIMVKDVESENSFLKREIMKKTRKLGS